MFNLFRKKRCENCDEIKPDVRLRLDPYGWELYDQKEYMYLCDDCEQSRHYDV